MKYRPAPVADPETGALGRTTALLVNLGTPSAPTAPAVRRYLAEFLADPRVVELPRWLWLPALYGLVLPLRARRSARAYATVWTGRGSPLAVFSEDLRAAVQRRFDGTVTVELAMRYGEPGIAPTLRRLDRDGQLRRLLVLPLYPQFSATTTASVFDAVSAELARWRRPPAMRWIDDYALEPAWLDAIAARVRRHWREQGRGDRLLFSLHGIPQRYVEAGDPYAAQCRAGVAAIAARLGLAADAWQLSFQSRVGREPWLRPYTDQTVRELAAAGIRRLDVVCPGFAVDCLETLEEVAVENRGYFLEAGGEHLSYIPCLNADAEHAELLAGLIRRHGQGWPGLGDAGSVSP